MDLSEWTEMLKRYNYEDPSAIYDRVSRKGLYATQEDYDIIDMIVLWKINRCVKIHSETTEYINAVAKQIETPMELSQNKDVADCINELLQSHGVRLPIASAILHFYQPKAFPIIDERSYRQVFNKELKPNAGVDIYLEYVKACMSLCNQYVIPFERIDKVLYQLDIEKGNKLKRR